MTRSGQAIFLFFVRLFFHLEFGWLVSWLIRIHFHHDAHVVSSGFSGLEIYRGVCGLWSSGAIRMAMRPGSTPTPSGIRRLEWSPSNDTNRRPLSCPSLTGECRVALSLSRIASPRASRSLYRSPRAARALSLTHVASCCPLS